MQSKRRVQLVVAMMIFSLQSVFVSAKPPDWIPPEMLEMVAGDKERCMQEHGTTQALIDQVNDGKLTDDRSLSCYMFCLLEAFSLVDEEGNLESEMLLGFLPENLKTQGEDILNTCAKQDGSDGCEKILNVAKCVQSKVPELWFMV